jgi:putative phosphoesterase
MKIGIVSDTHRNKEYLQSVVKWLVEKRHIATLYHLGDDYEDAVGLDDYYIDVVQVPGIYHQGYRDGSLSPKIIETVVGVRICLVHSLEKDFTDQDTYSCDIVLHGHTHKPQLLIQDGILYMNPGHLKGAMDKNTAPSFGFLDIQERTLQAQIYSLDFECINAFELGRSDNGLYKM